MRWGILSTGRLSWKFASTICEMKGEGDSIIAVGSQTESRARDFAREFDIPEYFGSYEEVLDVDEVEVVYIATPNSYHYENVRSALLHGKPVVVECPITLDPAQAKELYDLAREKNLFLLESAWIHFLPGLLKVQELIRGGVIGKVSYVRTEYGVIPPANRSTRYLSQDLGGGALYEVGMYNLSLIYMIMGSLSDDYTLDISFNESRTDDFNIIHFKYPGGQHALVTNSIGLKMERRAAIVGTEGAIYIEDFVQTNSFILKTSDGQTETFTFNHEFSSLEHEIREVERYIAWGKTHASVYTPEMSIEVLTRAIEIKNKFENTRN